jgi:hypothetical protein
MSLSFSPSSPQQQQRPIRLSSAGLVQVSETCYENEFAFIVGAGAERDECPLFVADFLSPRIPRLRQSNSTLREFIISPTTQHSNHFFRSLSASLFSFQPGIRVFSGIFRLKLGIVSSQNHFHDQRTKITVISGISRRCCGSTRFLIDDRYSEVDLHTERYVG